MIEAVGWQDFGTFFERCSELLAPNGTMLLQAITMDDRAYAVEKASKSFIRTYVFPGGCLPSLEVISKCVAKRTDLRTVHLEDLTPHYAETLRRWRDELRGGDRASSRPSATTSASAASGACTSSYCEAGFAERRIGLVQTRAGQAAGRASTCSPSRAPPARSAAVG